MKDISEVREGVTLNLPKFIEVLNVEQRESFIDKLSQAEVDPKDWRKRVIQAKQIKQFSKVFAYQTVQKNYVPIFFTLCQDQVAEVRIAGAKGIKTIILKMNENPTLFDEFLQKVLMFRKSNKYNLRQTFICMCASLMNEPACKDLFVKYFLCELLELQTDRVINVRMQLSESLATHHKKDPAHSLINEIQSLREMVNHLLNDSSRDVREPLMGIVLSEVKS